MSDRFYIDPEVSSIDEDRVTLRGDEAHHFSRVMRGRVGDEIMLFDGIGLSWRGIVEMVSKTNVSVRILKTIPDTIESPLRITVASALPKGDRQRFLVEKLAELGVARFVPLHLDRSVARANDGVVAKFRRYVIEAAKQCGRNVLMEVTEEKSLRELGILLDGEEDTARLLLHPASLGAENPVRPRDLLAEVKSLNRLVLVIGPEGSFTDAEVDAALSYGFRPLDLGTRILRTETACVAAASVFLTY